MKPGSAASFADPSSIGQPTADASSAVGSSVATPSQWDGEDSSAAADFSRALASLNGPTVAYAASCIHQLFALQARRSPEDVAVTCRNESLTYSQLDQQSNQLARYLATFGVGRGSLVAICLDRSLQMVVGLLGILKAGSAYVPLDPSYPDERIQMVLEDCGASVVVTREHLVPKTSSASQHVLLDSDWPAISKHRSTDVPSGVTCEDLAYVIYTSGSTGKPKGVMVSHRNVANLFAGMDQRIPGPPGVWLSVTSISFDISVLELFWTLSKGFQVVIQSEDSVTAVTSRKTSARQMLFSLFYFASEESLDRDKYKLLIDGARFADSHGFHAIWTPERHFHQFGGLFPNPSVISAAIAVITSRLQIRAGSVVLPLHDPIRVAEEWSTVDNLSNGRVGISFASGWHEQDFVLAPANFTDRRKVLFRDLDVVRRLWRGESLNRPSGVDREVAVSILPRPLQPDLPTWVTAAGDPETFRAAGECGANLLTHLLGQSIDQVARNIAIYRDARAASHPDAGPGQVTLMIHTFVGNSVEEVRQAVREPLTRYLKSSVGLMKQAIRSIGHEFSSNQLTTADLESLIDHAFDRYFMESGLFGTPETCRPRVERLLEGGGDDLAGLSDFGVEPELVLSGLDRLSVLKEQAKSGEPDAGGFSIPSLIAKYNVTHLQCTPSMARMILSSEGGPAALARLDVLCVGGEAMRGKLSVELEDLLPGRVWNMYGPTETTVWSTTHRLAPGEDPVPIGEPIANTFAYIVDAALRPVPFDAAGELLLGGDGVARGYWNRPDLTKQRFLPDPFRSEPTARVYRTGDLVTRRPDGSLLFLGRLDEQVKVRGHRIELGEVETALAQHPVVIEAAAACMDISGEPSLVGYIVPRETLHASAAELKAYLARKLPAYMVPSAIVVLPAFPLTPNGKVDRKQLPPPGKALIDLQAVEQPRNSMEAALVSIWKEVLQLPTLGIHDDFFEIGGHSLSAVQLTFGIREAFGVDLPLTSFLRQPTIAGQADMLKALTGTAGVEVLPTPPAGTVAVQPTPHDPRNGGELRPSSPLVAIQSTGSKPPFFIVHAAGGGVLYYSDLARHLGPDQRFYALRSLGLDGSEELLTRVEAMASRYVTEIRQLQPEGPYYIGGLSLGGLIAFEMAQQLLAKGQKVGLLVLFDTHFTGSVSSLSRHLRVIGTMPIGRLARRILQHLQNLAAAGAGGRLAYVRSVSERAWVRLARSNRSSDDARNSTIKRSQLRRLYDANVRAGLLYKPRPYPGRIIQFLSSDPPLESGDDSRLRWRELALGGLELHVLPGAHFDMVREPNAQAVAENLRQRLDLAFDSPPVHAGEPNP